MIDYLHRNIGWYLSQGIINVDAAKNISDAFPDAVKDLVPHINDIVEAFNIYIPAEGIGQYARDEYWRYPTGFNKAEDSKPFDFTKEVIRPRL